MRPAAPARKFYVVWKGRQPGIYATWEQCKSQVDGFADAKYKAFATRQQAEAAFHDDHADHIGSQRAKPRVVSRAKAAYIEDSISVDAACSGNPGQMEYRAIHTTTGKQYFRRGPFEDGTNNIGEFLAIVHALTLCADKNIILPIYSDSKIAIRWVKDKHCRTNLKPSARNAVVFTMVAKAEQWLYEHAYTNRLLRWHTEAWGENPADFGRK